MHAPNQPPTYTKTMTIIATEDNHNSSWSSDSTTIRNKIMSRIGWKEGGGIRNTWQVMTTNLRAYSHYYNVGVGATTDLHSDLERLKNASFCSLLMVLMRDHQEVMTGNFGTDFSPTANSATAISSSSKDLLYLYLGGGKRGYAQRRRVPLLLMLNVQFLVSRAGYQQSINSGKPWVT